MRLTASLLCAAFAAAAPGCGASGHAVIVADGSDPPPAPREEDVTARPGYVWIEGHWMRDHDRWRWHGGFYERERPGYVYAPGRWIQQGDRYVWVDGRWRTSNTVVIRGRGRF